MGSEAAPTRLRVVVDANVLAAALIRPAGWVASILARPDVDWVAPATIVAELEDHGEEFAGKAGCSLTEWRARLVSMLQRFRVVTEAELVSAIDEDIVVRALTVDPGDADYFAALAVARADVIWTFDKALIEAFPRITVSAVPPTPQR